MIFFGVPWFNYFFLSSFTNINMFLNSLLNKFTVAFRTCDSLNIRIFLSCLNLSQFFVRTNDKWLFIHLLSLFADTLMLLNSILSKFAMTSFTSNHFHLNFDFLRSGLGETFPQLNLILNRKNISFRNLNFPPLDFLLYNFLTALKLNRGKAFPFNTFLTFLLIFFPFHLFIANFCMFFNSFAIEFPMALWTLLHLLVLNLLFFCWSGETQAQLGF